MPTNSTLHSLFAHKAWANAELFAILETIDANAFAAQMRTAVRLLNHVYVVDSIFKAHLNAAARGYDAANTKQMPALPELAESVKRLDAWYLDYVGKLEPDALRESVSFAFTDGKSGLMTREEILLHVVMHGSSHRGAVDQSLRATSAAPLRDMYTRFLHDAQPERRARISAT